jgi:hypothetical protein
MTFWVSFSGGAGDPLLPIKSGGFSDEAMDADAGILYYGINKV